MRNSSPLLFILLSVMVDSWRLHEKLSEFACADGKHKILLRFLCDGVAHCQDKSDEKTEICAHSRCWSERWFRCRGGGCIPIVRRCDGHPDCWDSSDEADCPYRMGSCKLSEWRCKEGSSCIPLRAACNGTAECADQSDETSDACATAAECPGTLFRCDYGACVDSSLMCDGVRHCVDGSDENTELCEPNCKIPKVSPPLQAMVLGCNNNTSCKFVPDLGALQYSCSQGYKLIGEQLAYCISPTLVPPELPTCEKIDDRGICPGLGNVAANIDITCYLESGSMTSCKNPLPPGSIARMQCLQNSAENVEAICENEGKWSADAPICTPECGIAPLPPLTFRHTQNQTKSGWGPLIVHGTEASPGQWPWQVALYYLQETASNISQWRYQCGGTLVSDTAVITASHCVFRRNSEDLSIAVGKYQREYEIPEPDAQIIQIRKVFLPEAYLGDINSYDSDIALLALEERVKFGSHVVPACLDWEQQALPSNGNTGVLAGWGFTEFDKEADVLRYARLNFISLPDCVMRVTPDFRKYLRTSTFCAGTNNGTSACNGDSGGGLMFPLPTTRAWSLQGVVSLSLRRPNGLLCDPLFPAVFTKVQTFLTSFILPWMKQAAAPFLLH